jgi:hypothetical protein
LIVCEVLGLVEAAILEDGNISGQKDWEVMGKEKETSPTITYSMVLLHTACFAGYRTVPCTEVGKVERKGTIGNGMPVVRVRARQGQGVEMGEGRMNDEQENGTEADGMTHRRPPVRLMQPLAPSKA